MTTPHTTNPRRFEFSEGNSNKFWELSVTGAEVTVRYGRTPAQQAGQRLAGQRKFTSG